MLKKHLQPLISVLLPVYNGEKFLAEAVQSVLNQTLSDFELICINDGSTDKSLNILKRFAKKDKRVFILNNPKNIGMAASLNLAMSKARGKYIARMDSDDISLPTRFSKQIDLLKSDPKLVAVGGQEEIIDENGQVKAVKFFPISTSDCYQTLANFMPIQPPLLLARADAFKRCRYNTAICKNDDINIYFQLLQFGQMSNVNEIIFQYRQLNTSLTHSNAKSVFFMALKNRIDGILHFGYRPSALRLAILALESLFALLVPSSLIVKAFEFVRYQRNTWNLSYTSVSFLILLLILHLANQGH